MRISEWECTTNHDGTVRAVKHRTEGAMVWNNGRIIGHGNVPRDVFEWLMRPRLRQLWSAAFDQGATYAIFKDVEGPLCMSKQPPNPYEGEPPNKDHEPS